MQVNQKSIAGLVATIFLTSCASVPSGPSNMALPGTGKDFNQFRAEDASCKQYANDQIGGKSANEAANSSFVGSAVVGTVIGALAGIAVGGERGAAAGAGTGLLFGSVVGSDVAGVSADHTQQRYDNAYTQCMYASGNRVAVSGHVEQQERNIKPVVTYYPPPPPPNSTY